MKACTTCKESRTFNQFYADRRRPDGLKTQCKACHCRSSIRGRDPDQVRKASREWQERSGYRKRPEVQERERLRSSERRSSHKVRVRLLTNKAICDSILVRPDVCEMCGVVTKPHAHHDDYNKPLDVRWLCVACHGKVHRKWK